MQDTTQKYSPARALSRHLPRHSLKAIPFALALLGMSSAVCAQSLQELEADAAAEGVETAESVESEVNAEDAVVAEEEATTPAASTPKSNARDADTLDEVVVTASRSQERKREVTSNVTVISEADIKASTASTVADVLVQQGLFVVTTGDTSGVQIRGFGSLSMPVEYENTVLILLNGRRTGSSNVALANLANVERIEIIRGPSAVQYGSSAMGGVINIITKQGGEKPVFSFEVGLGSDSLVREKLAVSGAAGGFDYALGATNFRRDDLTMNDGERWYHTNVKHHSMLDLDLGYTFVKNHRIGLNTYYGDLASNLPGTGFRSGNDPALPYSSYNKRTRTQTLSYTGRTEDRRFDWQTSYSFGGYDQKNPASLYGPAYTNELKTRTFNVQGGYNGGVASASVGVDYYKYDIRPNNVPDDSVQKDLGVYATGKLRFLDEKLIFSTGVRHDWYNNNGDALSRVKENKTTGSVGLAFLPVDWLKLRANYAEGFKMPSPAQISGNPAWGLGPNPALKPEKSETWEFGADVTWNYLAGSLTYFHSDWKSKIVYRPARYENLDAATLAGVEGSLSVDIGKALEQSYSLRPYVNLTWLETRKNRDRANWITVDGKTISTLPNTPEWMASYGLDYAHPVYKFKSRINANYYGRQYRSSVWPAYTKQNSGTVVNLSLEKELADLGERGAVTLRGEVNNLFDGANEQYYSYPGAGRNFYLGLRYDF